jgi:hypothetical protein
MSKPLISLTVSAVAFSGGFLGVIATYFWLQTTAIPIPVASSVPDNDLGKQACQDTRQVKLKISYGNAADVSYLTANDVKTLFTCRLYQGLGQKAGAIVKTEVSFAGDRIRSLAVVNLSHISEAIDEPRSEGATLLSQIAFKVRKTPFFKDKTVFLAIEGKPTVINREFVFYGTPTIQIGNQKLTLKDASNYFRIPELYAQEWLEKEYRLLPMEPSKISLNRNLLELRGSRTAW